ncbi:unnamed protein product [Meloidogyne enterolobii]|uniref:Uncharacterized protein n=1 Tax=Meloidogyne enterolobii TaxID=390850 RepID=A0ACB1ABY9_MELEN
MWQIYDLVFKTFNEEGATFFADCMPVLHAFLTVGSEVFLSSQEKIQMLLSMCEKTICDNDSDELGKAHAAKMLEVFVLQSQGHPNSCLPHILRLVLTQLQIAVKDEHTLEQYKSQLLMILVAGFYNDSNLSTSIFEQSQINSTQKITFEWFLEELYENRDNFEGIHDRKMLIWFLCRLLSSGLIPTMFQQEATKMMDWLIDLFKDLQRCIKGLADKIKEDSDDEDEESSDDNNERMNGELKDSDDDVDEHNMEYLEAVDNENNNQNKKRRKRQSTNSKSMGEDQSVEDELFEGYETTSSVTDDEDYHHFQEENDLEAFTTLIDDQDDKQGLNVFVLFKHTFEVLKQNNPLLFDALCDQQKLGEKRIAELKALTDVCIREENLVESKQLAQSGGYSFDANQPVPGTFKFA